MPRASKEKVLHAKEGLTSQLHCPGVPVQLPPTGLHPYLHTAEAGDSRGAQVSHASRQPSLAHFPRGRRDLPCLTFIALLSCPALGAGALLVGLAKATQARVLALANGAR